MNGLFAVGGAVVGVGGSWLLQGQQLRAAKRSRMDEKTDAAIDAALGELDKIRKHLRTATYQPSAAESQVWDAILFEHSELLGMAALRLQPTALRIRITDLCALLPKFTVIYHPVWGGAPDLPEIMCTHGLECLGEAARGRPVPPEHESIVKGKQAVASHEAFEEEQWQMTLEVLRDERAARRADDDRAAEPE